MSQEKRLFKRKLLNSKVKLSHPQSGDVEGLTRDISNGGVFVIVPPGFQPSIGEECQLRLVESGNPELVFSMKVIRHDKAGIGLMFLGFEVDGSHHEMKHLKHFMNK